MKETIGFIGLGSMGLAIAANLLKAGFGLRVYNRTADKARPLLKQGAVLANSPAEAAEPGGVVVTMVSDDHALEEVTLGPNGFLGRLGDGVHLSMSDDRAAHSAPAGGVAPGARRPLCGLAGLRQAGGRGPGEVVDRDRRRSRGAARVRPLLEATSQRVFDFGDDAGAANVIKLAGNFLLGAAIEAMAEAFTLAQKHGVPRRQTYEFFTQTLFDCFVYRGYGELVASEHYQPVGARPSLIRKDYGLILEAAGEALVPMPLAGLIHDRLTATVAKGREGFDWSGFAREASEGAGL